METDKPGMTKLIQNSRFYAIEWEQQQQKNEAIFVGKTILRSTEMKSGIMYLIFLYSLRRWRLIPP